MVHCFGSSGFGVGERSSCEEVQEHGASLENGTDGCLEARAIQSGWFRSQFSRSNRHECAPHIWVRFSPCMTCLPSFSGLCVMLTPDLSRTPPTCSGRGDFYQGNSMRRRERQNRTSRFHQLGGHESKSGPKMGDFPFVSLETTPPPRQGTLPPLEKAPDVRGSIGHFLLKGAPCHVCQLVGRVPILPAAQVSTPWPAPELAQLRRSSWCICPVRRATCPGGVDVHCQTKLAVGRNQWDPILG